MSAKLVMPENPVVGLLTAMAGVARGGSKEEWESDSGATIHISYDNVGIDN